jgi:fatty acid desaturase
VTALPPNPLVSPFAGVDLRALEHELRALKHEAIAELGPADLADFLRVERWGRMASVFGLALAWFPNPFSPLLLAIGATARWACVAHHVIHKGLDHVPGAPHRLTSHGFARGRRRYLDWLDWLHPGAWAYEHNVLHHAYTNEWADPDLVQDNTEFFRRLRWPRWLKLMAIFISASTWKFSYYTPNTLQVLQRKRGRIAAQESTLRDDARGPETTLQAFNPRTAAGRETWLKCMLPYIGLRFGLLPLLFAPLGLGAMGWVLFNLLLAEVLTNLHSYAIVVPNHAGDDLYRFSGPPLNRYEWFARQIVSSVNYRTGGNLNDFLHGYLNYQIEHHLYPDLPPSAYQRLAPRVKAICERYGLRYVQESVWKRNRRMLSIMTGEATMPNA